MVNPIIIFWKWLNPFSPTKKERKQWDRKKKVALLKAAITCSLLIPVVIFYIKCNEVSVLFTNITSSNLYGDIPLSSEISVCYDFSRRQDFPTDRKSGIELQFDISRENASRHPEPVFSEKSIAKLKRNKNAGSFLSFYPYAEDLLSLNDLLKRNYSKSSTDWDSICGIYKISIENKAVFPLKPFFIDRTSDKSLLDPYWHKSHISSCTLGMPSITSNDTVRTNVYYLSDGHNYCTHSVHLNGTSFRYYRNILIDARDISRSVEIFKIAGDMQMRKLGFYFLGSTEFSAIYPNPDIVSINSIEYNNPDKLAIIAEQGLTFHTKFSDMENKQQARMFAITTVLTLLITLLLKYLYILTVDFWRRIYDSHKRLFYVLFVAILTLPLLYLFISLYFPIIL